MPDTKKVMAGAAIGVAIPAAVGVAKKLLGESEDGESSSPRSGTSSRQIAATCARVSARVVSTGTFGRAHPAVGSTVTQSASIHQASADRSADRCRARVAGASPLNALVKAASRALAPSGVPSTATSPAAARAVSASCPPRAARARRKARPDRRAANLPSRQ